MAQPVRMGIVFPRSGQRLFVTVPILAGSSREQCPDQRDDNSTCRSKAIAMQSTNKSE